MTSYFKTINQTDTYRTGELTTRRGVVKTPTFMPDGTRGAVKGMLPYQVKATGVQVMLSNTYHLHLSPGEAVIKNLGGIHKFSGWDGPILTDSGGFQIFSLSKIRKITEEGVEFKDPRTGNKVMLTPEESMRIQIDLGSDLIVAFDDLSGLSEEDRARSKEAYDRTHRWLVRSIEAFRRLTAHMDDNERPLLFGVAQGGLDKELRQKSLEIIQASDVDCIAVGGLSVGETRQEMWDILEYLQPIYDNNRARFLLGVGDPADIRYAIEHGIDMMDCVLPTRNARHSTVWVSGDKKVHLTNSENISCKDPIETGCACYSCSNGFSRGFLRHQFKNHEPLAGTLASMHNLHYLCQICQQYR